MMISLAENTFFRDLLQFPPIKEQSPFMKMSRSEIHKYLDTMVDLICGDCSIMTNS